MRNVLLLLLSGCYGIEYTDLPVDLVDTTGTLTTWGIPSQATAEDMESILEEFTLSTGELSLEEYNDCMRFVDVIVVRSEEISYWCNLDIPGEHLTGCMYPRTTYLGYDGSHPDAWVILLREDHANWSVGLRHVLQHEAVHMLMYCTTGSPDASHRSHLYP